MSHTDQTPALTPLVVVSDDTLSDEEISMMSQTRGRSNVVDGILPGHKIPRYSTLSVYSSLTPRPPKNTIKKTVRFAIPEEDEEEACSSESPREEKQAATVEIKCAESFTTCESKNTSRADLLRKWKAKKEQKKQERLQGNHQTTGVSQRSFLVKMETPTEKNPWYPKNARFQGGQYKR